MARADNRDYLDGKMTATINWPLIAASTRTCPSIIETMDASAAQTVSYTVTGGLSTGTVHVWSTNVNSADPSTWFAHYADITPSNGSFSLTVQPGFVYSLTTTTGQGNGTAASPAQGTLSLPYSDNFDGDTAGQQPRYLSQMQGAFEVEPCTGGRSGQCLQQQAPVQPIEWDGNSNPYTIGGNLSWANYTVSADALVEQAGAVQLIGRAGTQYSFGPAGINEYAVRRHRPRPRQVPGHHQRRDRQRHARRAVTGPTTPNPSPPPAPSAVAGQR